MAPYLLLLAGQIGQASSVIMIKASHLHPALLASARMAIASLLVLPFWFFERRNHSNKSTSHIGAKVPQAVNTETKAASSTRLWRLFSTYVLPGLFLGIHFISWNAGARMTEASHATLIVNLVPLVMPVLVYVMLREKPTRYHLIGTAVAIVGLTVLAASDLRFSGSNFGGDLVCFASMLLFAVYLALARRNKTTGLWSYVLPLYVVGAVSSFLIGIAMVNPLTQDWSANELLPLALLALIPTLLGHTVSNWAMRRFHPQIVSVITVTQFVWAAILAWFFFGEVPPPLFYPASLIVVAGCVVAIVPGLPKKKTRDIKPLAAGSED